MNFVLFSFLVYYFCGLVVAWIVEFQAGDDFEGWYYLVVWDLILFPILGLLYFILLLSGYDHDSEVPVATNKPIYIRFNKFILICLIIIAAYLAVTWQLGFWSF